MTVVKIFRLIALAMLAAFFALHAQAREIVIGFAGPLSTPHAKSLQQAAQLAIDEANRRGFQLNGEAATFKLLPINDNNNPNVAALAARSMVAAHAVAVVGHYLTDTSLAAAPVYEAAGVAQVTVFSVGPKLTQQGFRTVFQLLGNIDGATYYMTRAAVETLHRKRIGIIDNSTASAIGQSLAEQLKKQGIGVIVHKTISAQTSDFNDALAALAKGNIDLVFFGGVLPQSYALAGRMKQTGQAAQLMLFGGAVNADFYQTAGQYPDGTWLMAHSLAEQRQPKFKTFFRNYVAAYKADPMPYSANAYDAVNMVIDAIRQTSSTDPKAISTALHALHYDGINGRIAFQADGRLINPPYTLYQVNDGRWAPVKTFP